MKKKAMMIMVVVCMVFGVCWGQGYWKRTYGRTRPSNASSITSTADGNFIVAGFIVGTGDNETYLLKITPHGDTLWSKTYPNCNYTYDIKSTHDGNSIVFGNGMVGKFIIKVKPNGDTLLTKTWYDETNVIAPTADGNFILAGLGGSNDLKVSLRKITSNGDILWTKMYSTNSTNYGANAYSITSTSDGNFVIAGSSRSFSTENMEINLLKIKPNGDSLWSKTIGGNGEQYFANAIISASDGNLILVGDHMLGSTINVYLQKITLHGDNLWTKSYGNNTGYSIGYALSKTSDENYIVVGVSNNHTSILKIKSNGDTLWTKSYGDSICWACRYSVTQTPDGNFIVAGTNMFQNGSIYLFSIIDDRYAFKDSIFTFKIPVAGDSLNHGYTALKVPASMIVSKGGTISWKPTTPSVYMDHVEFLVFDDIGNRDTLSFNIFVNSSNKPSAINFTAHFNSTKNQTLSICQISPSQIKFTLPSGTQYLDIYDIRGRLVQRIIPKGASAVWNGIAQSGASVPAGRYFAKISGGSASNTKAFMVVR